ncbi:MAG: dihydroorotate dehydrogenase electron transfer subunit [Candidatus Aenigmarchaeota archaeon]|nr:dihydroorotate dehydrogenase electron transfer subunit [Candidatus Aenigmarchaeota archaeon]
MEAPEIVKITKIIDEAEGIKSIFLEKKIDASPGQFVMVWIPRMDEKPFAIAYMEKDGFGITVAAVGPFSNKFCSMKPGDKVGFRGPYGTGYNLGNAKKVVMVGGGYGSASLALLGEVAMKRGVEVVFITGARTKSRLIYEDRIKKLNAKNIIATDDGSYGIKGRVTDALEDILKKEKIDKVFACGPELMLKKVADICIEKNVDCEVSIERYYKCGFGLCGHCCVDPLGIRVCVEGPVIDAKLAQQITEFGNYHRLKSGRKEKLGVVNE